MAYTSEIEKLERRWQENPQGLTFAPLAEAYRKAGDPGRALAVLETGLAQHPNYVPAHIVRGRCHLAAAADSEAELAFLRVTELDPENVIALKSLAELSERGGRLGEAFQRLQRLVDVDQNNEEAREDLERVRGLMGSAPAGKPGGRPSQPSDSVVIAALELMAGETEGVVLEDPFNLKAAAGSEFRMANDSEALSSSRDRLEDVVVGPELLDSPLPPPDDTVLQSKGTGGMAGSDDLLDLEVSGEAQGAYAGGPAEEPESLADELQLEPEEPASPPPGDAEPVEQLLTMERESRESLPDESVPLEGLYAAPAAVPAPPPEPEPEPEPIAAAEPDLVVTETMAEIFLRQGHRELALAVYTQLAQREPDNERIARAMGRLQQELAPAPEPEPPPPAPYDAVSTGGRSVGERLGTLLGVGRPAAAPAVHPPAIDAASASGAPTRPAPESLSLSAVFGEESPPTGPAGAPPPPGESPSFDEFFAAHGATDTPVSPAPGRPAPGTEEGDLEQFNDWLRSLKR